MFVTLQNSISVQNTDMSFQIKIRKTRLNPHNPKSFWKIKYSTAIAFQLFEKSKTLLLALLSSKLFKIDKSAAFSVWSTGTLCLLPISILGASAGTIRAVPDTVKKVSGLAPVPFKERSYFAEITRSVFPPKRTSKIMLIIFGNFLIPTLFR